MKNIIYNPFPGLGDALLDTTVCRHVEIDEIHYNNKSEKYSFLLKGLCKSIKVSNFEHYYPPNIGNDHFVKQKLRFFGIETDDIIPKIILDDEKVNIFKNKVLKDKPNLIFNANCSKYWSFVRNFPDKSIVQSIVNNLSKKFNIYQINQSENVDIYDNTIKIFDISLEDLTYYHAAIPRYFGVDTGSHHLNLACGGNVIVCIPENSVHYNHNNWLYNDHNRARYINFKDLHKFLNENNSLFDFYD